MGCVDSLQQLKKRHYDPTMHVVNASPILSKHKAKKHRYQKKGMTTYRKRKVTQLPTHVLAMPTLLLFHIPCPDQITLPHCTQNHRHYPQYSGQTPFWKDTSNFHYKPKLYMKGLRTVHAIPVSPGWLTQDCLSNKVQVKNKAFYP